MKLTHWAMAGLMTVPIAANAFDTRINGFLSVTAGMTLQEGQKFVPDPVNYDPYLNELSIKPETMAALQTRSQVNDRLSATTQLVGYAANDFDVKFEWAYVNYKLTNDIDLKVGRLRLPAFNHSSALDLGYAYAWMRPPVEVYNIFVTNLEGVSADYSFLLGNWYTTASIYYGETSGVDPESNIPVTFESMIGGNATLSNGNLSFRVSYNVDDDVTITRQFFNPSINEYEVLNVALPIEFSSISATYDDGTILLNGEYTLTRFTNKMNNNEHAWYATAGMRVGNITPHLTYSSFKQERSSNLTYYHPVYDANNVLLTVIEHDFADYPQDITSITAGLRWDFDIAAALKFELTSRTDNSLEPIGFEGQWSPFTDAQVVTIGLDVVF